MCNTDTTNHCRAFSSIIIGYLRDTDIDIILIVYFASRCFQFHPYSTKIKAVALNFFWEFCVSEGECRVELAPTAGSWMAEFL